MTDPTLEKAMLIVAKKREEAKMNDGPPVTCGAVCPMRTCLSLLGCLRIAEPGDDVYVLRCKNYVPDIEVFVENVLDWDYEKGFK